MRRKKKLRDTRIVEIVPNMDRTNRKIVRLSNWFTELPVAPDQRRHKHTKATSYLSRWEPDDPKGNELSSLDPDREMYHQTFHLPAHDGDGRYKKN